MELQKLLKLLELNCFLAKQVSDGSYGITFVLSQSSFRHLLIQLFPRFKAKHRKNIGQKIKILTMQCSIYVM